ncbi:hypothetical protein F5Y11DRAFT_195346 [Daldinia sp. FL1419]|nr:hypothetical protein F5Y11DRAFT_195346 [Daldinia sp. FL1419]
MSSAPFLLLSPALPSELLTYILTHHAHPTTLIICSSRSEFLASLADDVLQETAPSDGVAPIGHPPETSTFTTAPDAPGAKQEQVRQRHRLLSSPLYQIATSRYIRVVYIPTVTHLRAYLSVFSPEDSKVAVPPSYHDSPRKCAPCIILYGFLETHRDTSEWSAQGLGNSASALVELGHRLSWQIIVIEPRRSRSASPFEDFLRENVPFLSGGGRRLGPNADAGGWTGRTAEVGRVMKRWFCFQLGEWDINSDETTGTDATKP